MIVLYIVGLAINATAAILTGCASVHFFADRDMEKCLLEAVLCLANICFFISNSLNLKEKMEDFFKNKY